MTLRLSDLAPCFEGVVPSIISTTAPDGAPNVSYLSTVALVDEAHVGLSNQFFSKTAANLRANPRAALLVVDPRDGAQFALDVRFVETLTSGPVFERMAAQIRATSLKGGREAAMRLRGVDLHRVEAIREVRSPSPRAAPEGRRAHLARLAALDAISEAVEVEEMMEAALAALRDDLGLPRALVLDHDAPRERLVVVAGFGYAPSGVGSEVLLGEGVIGSAAADRRPVRVNDLSRTRRLVAATEGMTAEEVAAWERRHRAVAPPFLDDAMSRLAVPMVARGALRGVLFAESRRRLAFSAEDEAALAIVARELAAATALAGAQGVEGAPAAPTVAPPSAGPVFEVRRHAFDDSVFIDGDYLVKGAPGRILMRLLERHLAEGRRDFANRELRLDPALRLPDVRDNLETRLLLLRRRLDEKGAPIRIVRTGRGLFRLELDGAPSLVEAGG